MFKRAFLVLIGLFVGHLRALSADEIDQIGKKIWQNEASGREDLLVFWNPNEPFPSLGIGHNIWSPVGHNSVYTQDFTHLCNYFKKHGVTLPNWLEVAKETGAPWQSREDFYKDTIRLEQLKKLLVDTIPLQAEFMIDRMIRKMPEIVEAAPIRHRKKVIKNIELLRASSLGNYVLVDYLNFKGDGLNSKEVAGGQPWGLLAVLLDMPNNLNAKNVTKAFAVSAAKKLLNRIEKSPDYKDITFMHGWMKRISTYTDFKN